MRKVATNLPVLIVFFLFVTTPASARDTRPSENISEWMPRSFLPFRKSRTASGMAPMPICSVEPSSMSFATFSPMAFSRSPMAGGLSSMSGSSFSTMQSISSRWIFAPRVRGMYLFIWAIVTRSERDAASV